MNCTSRSSPSLTPLQATNLLTVPDMDKTIIEENENEEAEANPRSPEGQLDRVVKREMFADKKTGRRIRTKSKVETVL